jgi:hypothetical protein
MTEDKKSNNDEMINQMKKQNPNIKIKRTKDGGFQISNPRAPNTLLMNLLKRVAK